MFNAHRHLDLSDKEFDVIVELLVSVLKDLKVRKDVIADIGDVLAPLRQEIVTRNKFKEIKQDSTPKASTEK